MTTFTQRIKIINGGTSFFTLWLEPVGSDYGMSPGDEVELVVTGADESFCFHVVYEEKGVRVWVVEGIFDEVKVYQGGEVLLCGHNRRRKRGNVERKA